MKNPDQNIKVAVDNCIFSIIDNELCVLVIQMKKKPFTGMWALPGGLVKEDESVDRAAGRILQEETNIKKVYLEQLYTFGEIIRDPIQRVVSVAYLALIHSGNQKLKTVERYSDVAWKKVSEINDLAYDHMKILKYALKRLAWKLEYTNLAWSLLPREFTLTDLQKLYEVVLRTKLDKRNFRKKILSLGLIQGTGKKALNGAHRPAELFSFKSQRPEIVEVL